MLKEEREKEEILATKFLINISQSQQNPLACPKP
jgi:hypothetical protein